MFKNRDGSNYIELGLIVQDEFFLFSNSLLLETYDDIVQVYTCKKYLEDM